MDVERAIAIAKECGFEFIGSMDTSLLEFRQDVRDMCNPQACPTGYNRSWACPPAISDVDEQKKRADGFSRGILVQSVAQMEDDFDFESVMDTSAEHKVKLVELAERMREESGGTALPLGAGACPICPDCSYPDNPCRFPDKMISSMEACGLWVSKVCEDNGMKYNHGQNTVAFSSCCLFN